MIEYFVAKNGNDCNNGSKDAPFASIAGARDFIGNLKGERSDGRFYFYHILEELDRPGEWYLDRKTGILYFSGLIRYHNGTVVKPVRHEYGMWVK